MNSKTEPTQEIIKHPDERLRQVCDPVDPNEAEPCRELCEQLQATLFATGGMGLAAPQIGHTKRVFVRLCGQHEEEFGHKIYINPVIEPVDDEWWSFKEGCLSIPGVFAVVRRPKNIRIDALNEAGEPFSEHLSGFFATVAQHEYDHLDGIEFIDRLSKFKRRKLIEKLKKSKKYDFSAAIHELKRHEQQND